MHTRIPQDELKVFKSLKNIRVVFDVGSRDDIDYLFIKPKISLHTFEPNPEFFEQLKKQLKDNNLESKKIHINNFGLGDKEGRFGYNSGSQSIQAPDKNGVLIRKLDNYVKEKKIKKIDFLKIDTEGYELQVLKGALKTIKRIRYIQYELNAENGEIDALLLKHGFTLHYTGYRNMFCVNKKEEVPWIPETTQEGGQPNKGENYYERLKDEVRYNFV